MSAKKIFILIAIVGLFWSPAVMCKSSSGLLPEEIISSDELASLLTTDSKSVILDARSSKSFEEGHIRGAILPLSADYYQNEELFRQGIIRSMPSRELSLAKRMEKYAKESAIVTYCNVNCGASAVLFFEIKRLGFKNVKVMEEGFQTWESKGYPVTLNQQSEGSKVS